MNVICLPYIYDYHQSSSYLNVIYSRFAVKQTKLDQESSLIWILRKSIHVAVLEILVNKIVKIQGNIIKLAKNIHFIDYIYTYIYIYI